MIINLTDEQKQAIKLILETYPYDIKTHFKHQDSVGKDPKKSLKLKIPGMIKVSSTDWNVPLYKTDDSGVDVQCPAGYALYPLGHKLFALHNAARLALTEIFNRSNDGRILFEELSNKG